MAAPIHDAYGSVVAAMSVSCPAYRFDREVAGLREGLEAAAAKVSKSLETAMRARRTAVRDAAEDGGPRLRA